jgi:ATP-dependent Clp protease ATP-binding subunit ClpA
MVWPASKRRADRCRTVGMVFERFSGSARHVLALAEEESRRLRHGQIGTEHILLGILADGNSFAARALMSSGATLDASRTKVAEAVGVAKASVGAGALPFTDRAKRALDRASRLSLRRRAAHVETEHVLVSVLDVEGTAGQVLRGLGIDLAGLRDALDSPMEERSSTATTAPEPNPVGPTDPHCAGCGSSLDTTLSHRIMASRTEAEETEEFVVAYCARCGRVIGASRS